MMTTAQKMFLKLGGVVVVFILAFFLARLAAGNGVFSELASSYGYLGVFVLSFISGLNLIVPIPAISFLPLFLEVGLDMWGIIFIMSLGMTLADSVAYVLGRFGRDYAEAFKESKIVLYLDSLRNRYHYLPLVALFLFASFAPLPNEVLMIPLGFMRYRILHLLPIVLAGNLIFNTIAAFGVVSLFSNLL